jgi:diguanylate cyclase (GGDEF)-like protein/PAS domain S-box-containing protein
MSSRNRRIAIELSVAAALCVGAYFLSSSLDLFETFEQWSQSHESWQADEWFSVVIMLVVVGGVFAWRRWRELDAEIDHRTAAEAKHGAAEQRFAKTFSASPAALAVVSLRSGEVLEVNEEFERLTGWSRDEVIGRTPAALDFWASPEAESTLRQKLRRDGRLRNIEVDVRARTGAPRTTLLSAEILDFNGEPSLLGAFNDISDRKHLEEQLTHQAFHDQLTGLANRALFTDRVAHALARATRHGKTPAVLFLDLDDFKRVNDTLGHAAGDELLRAVTGRLATCVRVSDTCARLGGDEFAILLEDANGRDDAVRLAERIIPMLRSPFTLGPTVAQVGVSIGIAIAEPGGDADALLRNADLAMYIAKSEGKSRHTVFEPSMHAEVLRRLELETDLREALDRDQMRLHYQPIAAMATGEIIGVEALLRWQHPTRGLISPADFIPVAEETGAIIPIGRWVLHEACATCRRLQAGEDREVPLSITVNLSGRQIADPCIVTDVCDALEASGIAPSNLVLEITESVLVHNDRATLDRLWELKRLGVQLAIDDFGTGYSSLAYLQAFPVDILKIDKSFTDRIGTGADESPLSRAVVGLGSTLSIRTIAEGIETAAQWARLRELGCELGQGYHIARPVTVDRIEEMLGQPLAV